MSNGNAHRAPRRTRLSDVTSINLAPRSELSFQALGGGPRPRRAAPTVGQKTETLGMLRAPESLKSARIGGVTPSTDCSSNEEPMAGLPTLDSSII